MFILHSIPGKIRFVSKAGMCYVEKETKDTSVRYEYELSYGENYIPEISTYVILSDNPIDNSSNVYKIAIKNSIDFDIIKGALYVREKRDGDSYVYGKMTRKLKKLFNDKSIPLDVRSLIPVICDEKGIIWVPGFGVRDSECSLSCSKKVYIAIATEKDKN